MRQPWRQRRARTVHGASPPRSALRADCPGLAGRACSREQAARQAQSIHWIACVRARLLGLAARRRTRFVRFAHCAQTVAASQFTKRACARGCKPCAARRSAGAPWPARARLCWCSCSSPRKRRTVAPGGARRGDLWSDEDRRTGVGARSALRRLTRRNCLSETNAVSEASSATRPLAENRSAVGATRRPRNHEPSAGTAWRDAEALLSCDGLRAANAFQRQLSRDQPLTRQYSRRAQRSY